MQYLSPFSEEMLRPHIGKKVCAMMINGCHYYGTITDVKNGHLILNGPNNQNAAVCSHTKNKSNISKIKSKTKSKSVSVSAFYPGYGYGYGYGGFGYGAGLALSLGLLGLLFFL